MNMPGDNASNAVLPCQQDYMDFIADIVDEDPEIMETGAIIEDEDPEHALFASSIEDEDPEHAILAATIQDEDPLPTGSSSGSADVNDNSGTDRN
jgi:hypothetical protein